MKKFKNWIEVKQNKKIISRNIFHETKKKLTNRNKMPDNLSTNNNNKNNNRIENWLIKMKTKIIILQL